MITRRIVFTFDERALESAKTLQRDRKHNSLAETVRESISILLALENQRSQGFSELSVRNPDNGKERFIHY